VSEVESGSDHQEPSRINDLDAPVGVRVEVAKSFALVTLGCVAVVVGGARFGFDAYAQLAVAAILFLAATHGADRMPGGAARAGITLGGLVSAVPSDPAENEDEGPLGLVSLGRAIVRGIGPSLRELAVATAVAAIVFPPFFFGYVAYWGLEGTFELRAPLELASLALTQILLVAIPEESYFRGYLQTRLTDALPGSFTVRGVAMPVKALVTQAVAFGLLHFLVDPHPARLAVAFPGLLFGVLRQARGGIGASIFFHVLCNLYAETLALSVR